jgi:hypothetical protein
MPPEEKQKARVVVGILEDDLLSSANTQEARARSSLWHGLVEFLTMGLDPSLQLLAHQSTGPDVARDVVLARIADIKQALV